MPTMEPRSSCQQNGEHHACPPQGGASRTNDFQGVSPRERKLSDGAATQAPAGILNRLRTTLSTALQCVRPQTPSARQGRAWDHQVVSMARSSDQRSSMEHSQHGPDQPQGAGLSKRSRGSAPANLAAVATFPLSPFAESGTHRTPAPPHPSPRHSQGHAAPTSCARQHAVLPADAGGPSPTSPSAMTRHPMWPPLVPSPPDTYIFKEANNQKHLLQHVRNNIPTPLENRTSSGPQRQASSPTAQGRTRHVAVSDDNLQRRVPMPDAPMPDPLLRSMSSVATNNALGSTTTIAESDTPGASKHNVHRTGSKLENQGVPAARTPSTEEPLFSPARPPFRQDSCDVSSLFATGSTQQHRSMETARTSQALPILSAVASLRQSNTQSDKAAKLGMAQPLPYGLGLASGASCTSGLMVMHAASSGCSSGRGEMGAQHSVVPGVALQHALTGARQNSPRHHAPRHFAAGADGGWHVASTASRPSLLQKTSAPQLPASRSDSIDSAWKDEQANNALSLASCPIRWNLPESNSSEHVVWNSKSIQYATWPGSLGLYTDQDVATAVHVELSTNHNSRKIHINQAALAVGCEADTGRQGPATLPPVSQNRLPPRPLPSHASAHHQLFRDGPAVHPAQLRNSGPHSDPLQRLAGSVRRTLRVSSAELQEAVKASLLGNAGQQVHASLPTRSSNLDMELCTLNISKLDAELFGLVLIGRGGGGLVFRAVWQGAQVAVKFMIGKTSAAVSMGALEAVLAASVNHPNVVQTYGFDVTRVRESSFNYNNTQLDNSGIGSSAVASILRELEREKTRMQCHANGDDRASRGSSVSPGGTPPRSSELTKLALSQAQGSDKHGAADHNSIMATFNSEEGFGEPAELLPSNGWSLAQVLQALNTQPGMFMTHIIMEFCDRGTLLSALQRGVFKVGGTSGDANRFNDRVVLRAALRTARDIARGMQHLHASGIIHGDLKPGNVLLKGSRSDRRGFTAKVADFGLSKVVAGNALLEMHHWSTVTHMAPEVIQGTWCKQSDVYSFGVLLWQLMCGEPLPFKDLTIQQLVLGVSQGRLRLQWPRYCHPAVAKLGEACVAFEASMRPSFQEIGDVLVQIEQNVRNELRWMH